MDDTIDESFEAVQHQSSSSPARGIFNGFIGLIDFLYYQNAATKEWEIKGCEFGTHHLSSFSGHDRHFPSLKDHMTSNILDKLSTDFDSVIVINLNTFDFGQLKKRHIDPLHKKNIYYITDYNAFFKLLNSFENQEIAIVFYTNTQSGNFVETSLLKDQLQNSHKKCVENNTLVFMSGLPYADIMAIDKFYYIQFSQNADCQLAPYAKLLNFQDDIENDINQFPHYPAIIKPSNQVNGDGVIVAKNKEHAKLLISAIKNGKADESLSLTFAENSVIQFWQREINRPNAHPFFLLQQCIFAHPLEHHGHFYQPTGRLVFYVYEINHKRRLQIMDHGYWKLPREPLSQDAASLDSIVSHVTDTNQSKHAILILPETYHIIKTRFIVHINILFDYLFKLDEKVFVLECLQSRSATERLYALLVLSSLTAVLCYDFSAYLAELFKEPHLNQLLSQPENKISKAEHQKTSFQLFSPPPQKLPALLWVFVKNSINFMTDPISLKFISQQRFDKINNYFYILSQKMYPLLNDSRFKSCFINWIYNNLKIPNFTITNYASQTKLFDFLYKNDYDHFVVTEYFEKYRLLINPLLKEREFYPKLPLNRSFLDDFSSERHPNWFQMFQNKISSIEIFLNKTVQNNKEKFYTLYLKYPRNTDLTYDSLIDFVCYLSNLINNTGCHLNQERSLDFSSAFLVHDDIFPRKENIYIGLSQISLDKILPLLDTINSLGIKNDKCAITGAELLPHPSALEEIPIYLKSTFIENTSYHCIMM